MGNRTNLIPPIPTYLPASNQSVRVVGKKGVILGEVLVLEVCSYYLSPWGASFPLTQGEGTLLVSPKCTGAACRKRAHKLVPQWRRLQRGQGSHTETAAQDGSTQDYRHWPRDFWKESAEPAVSEELEAPWCSVSGEWTGWAYPVQCSMTHGYPKYRSLEAKKRVRAT